jgi:hypothetical protein
MSEKLKSILSKIVRENTSEGYNDDEVLILFFLKKVISQNPLKYSADRVITDSDERELVDVLNYLFIFKVYSF